MYGMFFQVVPFWLTPTPSKPDLARLWLVHLPPGERPGPGPGAAQPADSAGGATRHRGLQSRQLGTSTFLYLNISKRGSLVDRRPLPMQLQHSAKFIKSGKIAVTFEPVKRFENP